MRSLLLTGIAPLILAGYASQAASQSPAADAPKEEATPVEPASSGERKICTDGERATGSRLPRRVCTTVAEREKRPEVDEEKRPEVDEEKRPEVDEEKRPEMSQKGSDVQRRGDAVAFYRTRSALDIERVGDDGGNGFGIRGWASVNGPWFVYGEYQTASLDELNADLESRRFGGGMAGELANTAMWLVRAEFIDFGFNVDEEGFGFHGGAMLQASLQFGVFGTLGFLSLDDTDGLELNLGGKFNLNRDWAIVLDYRTYLGEYDIGGLTGDFTVDDLRVGAAYTFY